MTVSGKERYTVSYAYDANNRLLTERKTHGLLTDLTTYAYDANGSLLSKTFNGGDGSLTGATYTYNLFDQLSTAAENGLTAAYAYNVQGIRTCKATATSQTDFLLDGGNVVGEHIGSKTVTYLRGANLISRLDGSKKTYYLFNAHGDVTELLSDTGTVTHKYDYGAFGVEKKPDPLDGNPFRYCGEYYDGETKTYYLRARYYDPNIGRFTQQDTHWNTANSIYGDNPQKINEREDKLGLKTYSYAPQITAVMQSGNLYVYGVNNPVAYVDTTGNFIISTTLLLIISGAVLVGTAGALIGNSIANQAGATGWSKVGYIAGGAAIGALVGGAAGWAAAPTVVSATGVAGISVTTSGVSIVATNSESVASTIASAAADSISTPQVVQETARATQQLATSQVTPSGQFHHVLSNPIMRALNAHPTLSNLYRRNDSVVQALTQSAHKGYQTWHRMIDSTMVAWLNNPANMNASPKQFWLELYRLYNTPEMRARFGDGVLRYIEGMMK